MSKSTRHRGAKSSPVGRPRSPRTATARGSIELPEIAATGKAYFDALVLYLERALAVDYVVVAELLNDEPPAIASISGRGNGKPLSGFTFRASEAFLRQVPRGKALRRAQGLNWRFPAAAPGAPPVAAAVAVPLANRRRRVRGVLMALQARPLADLASVERLLRAAAPRASAELERWQADRALIENRRYNQLVLDALSAHVAVLDADGHIVTVNRAWRQFARENNSGDLLVGGPGTNYFHVCENAARAGSVDAQMVLDGIRSVLSGEQAAFEYEYACHSPTERRWFLMHVMPRVEARGVVITHENITPRRHWEDALRRSQAQLIEAQRAARLGHWEWDIARDDIRWSEEIYRMLGLPPSEAPIKYEIYLQYAHPDDRARLKAAIDNALATHEPFVIEYRMVRPDGGERTVHGQGSVTVDAAGEPVRLFGTCQDVTESRLAEIEMRKLSSAIRQTADAVIITDRHDIIEYVNQAFEATTGFTAADVIGRRPSVLRSGMHDNAFYQRLWHTILAGETFRDVFINRRKNGDVYYEEKTITPLKNESGVITHFISTGKDITERMQTQERLQYLAHHDALTGLANRLLFLDRLSHALVHARWHSRMVAVMFLDLDRFKTVNDSLGHIAGDDCLHAVAERLQSTVREGDTVARLGGDEFAIVVEDVAQPMEVTRVAEKLLQAFASPYIVGGHEFWLTASIGISFYPNDGSSAEQLLSSADAAMYHAKELGKNNFQFYSSDLTTIDIRRLTLEAALRRALQRSEFRLYYQPQYSLHTERISGVEALIRWQHPELGLVSPAQFIPIAEETGMIVPIGEWVISTVCRDALTWGGDLRFAVNVSGRQFNEPQFGDRLRRLCATTGMNVDRLELEITESVIMHNAPATAERLKALRELGVRFAIDDFGTGYSSLNYLRRFVLHTLKIDRSFIGDVTRHEEGAEIVKAIVTMGHGLHLQVIAEGVEEREELDFLRRSGCDAIQGYYYSRPLPADEIVDLLSSGRSV